MRTFENLHEPSRSRCVYIEKHYGSVQPRVIGSALGVTKNVVIGLYHRHVKLTGATHVRPQVLKSTKVAPKAAMQVAFIAEALPPENHGPLIPTQRHAILLVAENGCRHIYGDTKGPYSVCGHPVAPGSPYKFCSTHDPRKV